MPDRIGHITLPVRRLHIELTNRCNFACKFCPDRRMTRPRGDMPFDMARGIIDEAAESGIAEYILFHVMGEPTLHPDLAALTAHAGSRGLKTCITTNGALLDDDLLNGLIDAGADRIAVSVQTPDADTFPLRGAGNLSFDEYAARITAVSRRFMKETGKTNLSLVFFSSPLRRLPAPVAGQFKIADTSAELRGKLNDWADRILADSPRGSLHEVSSRIARARATRENTIPVTRNISFQTRIVGDWADHDRGKVVEARFGYCAGITENFGILHNGDYVFCCADYDGKTSTHNCRNTSMTRYLSDETVQATARGFSRFRVTHPYCRKCLGDSRAVNSVFKQIGSIVYFKFLRRADELL